MKRYKKLFEDVKENIEFISRKFKSWDPKKYWITIHPEESLGSSSAKWPYYLIRCKVTVDSDSISFAGYDKYFIDRHNRIDKTGRKPSDTQWISDNLDEYKNKGLIVRHTIKKEDITDVWIGKPNSLYIIYCNEDGKQMKYRFDRYQPDTIRDRDSKKDIEFFTKFTK